ncbi:MAG: serine/threonine-protein kinase [Chloroflexota bacterium]
MTDGQGDLIGRRIADRYRVDQLIARGGMARVFRAHDERLARDVAVKVLAEPYASDAAFAERFLAEARTAAGLAHTNLVHVYDSGADEGLHYIVMELLTRYRTLRQRLADEGPLPAADAVTVVRDVLAGLALVHDRGFVHCDVKTSNVMVGPGPVKLIDFGIARTPAGSGRDGTSLGSLHAMPPEQLRSEELSPASDLYAAGVVLFEVLTGRPPFDAQTAEAMLVAQAGPVPRPSDVVSGVPRRIDEVIAQALRADADDRFRNARAMSTALEVAAESSPAAAPGDETREIPLPPRRVQSDAGYVPPLALPAPPHPTHRARRAAAAPSSARRRGSGLGAWVVAVVGLAGVAFVIWLVVSSASGLRIGPAGSSSATPSTASGSPSLAPGTVLVPNTIGMSEAEAEAAARAAGLRWRIEWTKRAGETPGIYDQEPAAGTPVDAGSRFIMYAWRAPD